jgi:hypothetical protein
MTLVDDQQIDCVVRVEVDGHPVYIDVQVKARSKRADQPGTFAALEVRDPRPNFMFVFYSEAVDSYWVVPSVDLVRMANQNKGGEEGDGRYAGRYTIVFTGKKSGKPYAFPRFDRWRNNWDAFLAMATPLARPGAMEGRPS